MLCCYKLTAMVKQNRIVVPYARSCTGLSTVQLLSGDDKARTRWIKHQAIVESSLDFVKFVLGSSSSTLCDFFHGRGQEEEDQHFALADLNL